MKGRIIKGIGGFYYVHTGREVYACRARGIFRLEGTKPLVGDRVEFCVTDERDMEGNIVHIEERESLLIRPSVANVDQVLCVLALKDPDPTTFYIDSFLVYTGMIGMKTILFFNKADLDTGGLGDSFLGIYGRLGLTVLSGSALEAGTIDALMPLLDARTTVLSGPSGAGKSTLTNGLLKSCHMEVGELSPKTGRGRQTTRHAELLFLAPETFLVDTPGFGSLELPHAAPRDISLYFPEFLEYIDECRFRDCSHIYEDIELCGVKRALERGDIAKSRYNSYRRLYEELERKGV